MDEGSFGHGVCLQLKVNLNIYLHVALCSVRVFDRRSMICFAPGQACIESGVKG